MLSARLGTVSLICRCTECKPILKCTVCVLWSFVLWFDTDWYHPYHPGHDDVIKWNLFYGLLALWSGNSPVTSEFSSQWSVTRSFDVSFDLRLNKRLRKTREAGDLRRYSAHYDVIVMGLCCWHRTNESFDPVAVIQHSIIWKNIKSLELVFLFTQTNDI